MPQKAKQELKNGDILAFRAPFNIEAAKETGKNATFNITAYNGGPMWLDSWMYKVVVDLAGLNIKSQNTPILADHKSHYSTGEELGITDSVKIEGNSIIETGELFTEDEPLARKIANKAKRKFPYQASIGAKVIHREFLEEGNSATVNGIKVNGPVYIARESELYETSIVTFGADETTNVEINAKNKEITQMDPNKVKKENEVKATDDNPENEVKITAAKPENKPETPPVKVEAANPEDSIQASRKAEADEVRRIAAIRNIDGIKDHFDIAAKAIEEGWNPEKAELEVLRASRPAAAPFVGTSGEGIKNVEILECAMRLNSSEPQDRIEANYKEQVLDMANKYRSVSIRGIIAECCRMEGVAVPSLNANPVEWVKAGFSTASLSTLLSNSANKMMLASFNNVQEVANIRKITKKLSANDFKTHTGVRLTANVAFDEVGSGGEIKHGSLGNDSFTYSIATYARMLGITRQMIINDDLNAFSDIPLLLGRGAALKMASVFWALFYGNANSFWHANNSNLDSNSTVPNVAGYKAAITLLRKAKDTNSDPISIFPKYVVAPVALDFEVQNMYASNNLLVTDRKTGDITGKTSGDKNIYAGRYEPVTSQYLDESDSADWYMLADPADCASFGAAYLHGQETPVIEEVALSGEYLGKAWRGYFDFGACQIDYQGSVKMA